MGRLPAGPHLREPGCGQYPHPWALQAPGALRTIRAGAGRPDDPWKTSIPLTQAEAAFRVQKGDLQFRSNWYHLEERVQAHILFLF